MKRLFLIALIAIFASGCAGYEHRKIRAEQERQIQEQRDSAEMIAGEMPAEQRAIMDEVAAAEERRQQAAIESRARQIESTQIPNTAGVDNRNHPLEDAAHGAAWWIITDEVKDLLNDL